MAVETNNFTFSDLFFKSLYRVTLRGHSRDIHPLITLYVIKGKNCKIVLTAVNTDMVG